MISFALWKFVPTGGEPVWLQPWDGDHGMGFIPPNTHCNFSTYRGNQSLDDKVYIYIAIKYSVQVVDTEIGKLVGDFGSYGNADCGGKGVRIRIASRTLEASPAWRYGMTSGLSWTF